MNSLIEIHDSVIDALSETSSMVVLHFSAVYIHKSPGIPGVDAGTGWVQKAKLTIADAVIKSTFTSYPADLLYGYLRLGDDTLENEIPIPLKFKGVIELRLETWNDQVILISGSGVELELIGEAEYVEEVPPDQGTR
jgi:hypothetical protein